MPSALPCSMEPQVSNLSYSTDHGDPNVLSHLPYDPDSPSIQFRQDINAPSNQYRQDPNAPSIPHRHSSSGDNHSSNSVKEHASPLNTAVGNIFPSRDKSFQFHVEPKGISNYPDVTSGIGNDVPLPTPNYCECSYCITSISFSRAGYSENRVADSLDCVGYNDPSFSKLSLASMPISKSGNYGRENISPSAYSLSPSKKSIFASVNEYPVVSQDKYKHKTPWRESNEALSANFPLSNGNRCKLQGGVGSFDSRGVCFRECDSFNCDIKHNQEFKGLYSDFQKKRNSVFSRLTLVPESYHQGNDTRVGYDESDIDTSADEVMEMLHQGHNHWMKKMRKPKLSTRQYDDDEKFRNRRQTTFYSQTMRNHSLLKPKEMNMDGIPDEEESGNVMVGWTQHVDFKCRSEVRKIKDETKKRECVECVESTGSLGMPRKRRKLVRTEL
ncbi:hypothetical protein L1049_010715 [Liquidambar formosana]|uniref:Uncharacterized protein n=1 Tax=Liquidambar formosana TaxID=63359 RepID=A0AAP0R2A7_LIQFO